LLVMLAQTAVQHTQSSMPSCLCARASTAACSMVG
jgi:hypothetical protein